MLDFIFNFPLLEEYGYRLVLGVGMTLKVVFVSCSIGFVLGYFICLARMSKNIILSNVSLAYITFFRGTPLLCQLYIVYYGAGRNSAGTAGNRAVDDVSRCLFLLHPCFYDEHIRLSGRNLPGSASFGLARSDRGGKGLWV